MGKLHCPSKQASSAIEIGFIDHRNRLRLQLKLVSSSNEKEWYLRGVGTSLKGSHDSPGGLQVAFFCLLPGYGKILPSTRAILCHFQAQNNTSGGKFGQDYHLDLGYGCSQSRFARKNPTLDFTLHSSPNRLKPR